MCYIRPFFNTIWYLFLHLGQCGCIIISNVNLYLVLDKGALFHSSQATELSIDFEEPAWFFRQSWFSGTFPSDLACAQILQFLQRVAQSITLPVVKPMTAPCPVDELWPFPLFAIPCHMMQPFPQHQLSQFEYIFAFHSFPSPQFQHNNPLPVREPYKRNDLWLAHSLWTKYGWHVCAPFQHVNFPIPLWSLHPYKEGHVYLISAVMMYKCHSNENISYINIKYTAKTSQFFTFYVIQR